MSKDTDLDTKPMEEVKYHQHKFKCMSCGLHFIICSDFAEWPDKGTTRALDLGEATGLVYCPECGDVRMKIHWQEEVQGFIFQAVPGQAEITRLEGYKGDYSPMICANCGTSKVTINCEPCAQMFCYFCFRDHWCGELTDYNGRSVRLGDHLQYVEDSNPSRVYEVVEIVGTFTKVGLCYGKGKKLNEQHLAIRPRLMIKVSA